MQQTKKWMPNSTSGWKVKLMIKHFDELVNCLSQIEILILILPLKV